MVALGWPVRGRTGAVVLMSHGCQHCARIRRVPIHLPRRADELWSTQIGDARESVVQCAVAARVESAGHRPSAGPLAGDAI
jgi:hypothetical protein